MPRRKKPLSPFHYFNSSREVVMMYVRLPLGLRNFETCWPSAASTSAPRRSATGGTALGRCLPPTSADIRRQRVSCMRGFRQWRWHLDEMCVKLSGEMVYLWPAVDQEGQILESYITKTRHKAAALTFMKKALNRHGAPEAITPDGLRSYTQQ